MKHCFPLICNFSRIHRTSITTCLGCHTCHTCSCKAIKHDISRLCIMQYVTHNSWMRNLRMICMCSIYRICFPLTHITGIRFFYLKVCLALSFSLKFFFLFFPLLNKVIQPRIRTSSIVWRVGEVDDIVIFSYRETLYLAKLRQTATQLFTEILTTFFIVFECESENHHWTLLNLLLWVESVEIIV